MAEQKDNELLQMEAQSGVWQLPGLREYRAREVRREVDRRVREHIMAAVEQARSALSDVQRDVLAAGGLQWMEVFDRVQQRLILLHDKVRSAAYGYRPVFDVETVDTAALERLLEFDRAVLAQVKGLMPRVRALREAVQSPERLGQALRELSQHVAQLLSVYTYRERAAHGEAVSLADVTLPEESKGTEAKEE